jgi:hypothetical protein
MFARVGVVRAVASRPDLAAAGKQIEPGGGRVVSDLRRQFAVKQRCRVTEPGRYGL